MSSALFLLSFFAALFFFTLSFALPAPQQRRVRTHSLFYLVASLCQAPLAAYLSFAAQGMACAVLLFLLFFSLWKTSLQVKD